MYGVYISMATNSFENFTIKHVFPLLGMNLLFLVFPGRLTPSNQ